MLAAIIKAAVWLMGLGLQSGTFTYAVSTDVRPEQLILLKRGVAYFNDHFGCQEVGLNMDPTMPNTYIKLDSRDSIVFVTDVEAARSDPGAAIAFSHGKFLVKSVHGVHTVIGAGRSFPSLGMIYSDDPADWQPWDWDLLRIVLHEIGHNFGLADDQKSAGGIMRGEEEPGDYTPISDQEIKAYVKAISELGFKCN